MNNARVNLNMTEEEAIQFAEGIALEEGWPWLLPVRATRKPTGNSILWEVVSNVGSIGSNVKVVFDEGTKRIVEKKSLPR